MHGFYDRILKIDLDQRSFEIDSVPEEIQRTYLGGKGLASYLLYTLNPPGVDPLAPENHLIFATGPVTQSSIWGSCRYGVFTKSPQTGFYSESYSGGRVPEAVDAAGFDAIVIRGACDGPTVVAIGPEGAKFHDAGDTWGMETYAAEDALNERFADPSRYKKKGAVVIGPAAENLVVFGVIENDYWRSAGRTGVGTILGSKKIKGLVFYGDRKRTPFSPDEVKTLTRKIMAEAKDSPAVKAYKSFGTPMMVDMLNKAKAFPTRYWSQGECEHREKINASALHSQCDVKASACGKCLMACGRLTTVKQGRHAGLKIEGPEYETLYAFGGLCMIDSIEEICYLNDLCDRLGMDTITAGNLCAFTMEAVERGRVDYDITYGDADGVARLLKEISSRQGIGDLLAQGIKPTARAWGLEDIAVHAKGLEPAGYDPRVLKGMGLAYATSDRGACHLRATFYKPELAGMIEPGQIENKAAMLLDFENRLTLFDTLILCRFYRDFYLWEGLGEMIHALTGISGDKATLQSVADAVSNVVRQFNLREGLTPADDRLPKGLHRELKKTGQNLEPGELEYMLKDYYRIRGWDEQGRLAPEDCI
ncbi:Aor8 [Desulforapulum autotrophicum HRM2]|uniref:Aor8 n=1 Tax=Desulforapulum autotrophicum (strain ATCC 43914 / DSM 3382 / VKM B-1955 / HRM2) TaxID=177437 RepID=C0QBC6_DESAH|nr:aldehyde ferredoxin oxidoreductase family protein [Desulforapulum autotrophicum]ACN16928.1 Aor8 [Desulforapulum autotrophicum HRM2]